MSQERTLSLEGVNNVREVYQRKDWLTEGAINLDGYVIEHSFQPEDSIKVPALADHLLAFTFNSSPRQFSRFAGETSDRACNENFHFLLPAGTPSEFEWGQTDESISFGIDVDMLSRTAERTEDLALGNVELKPILFGYDERITHIAHCLRQEIRADSIGRRLFSESLLTCLSIHLLRHYCVFEAKFKTYKGGLAPYKLRQAIAYIDANLTEDISLATLSELVGLSAAYFCRQFKQSTGHAPYQYVIRQRIEKSKQLLRRRQMPIAQIALECGFSNQPHFYGSFRRVVGTTPKRYQDSF